MMKNEVKRKYILPCLRGALIGIILILLYLLLFVLPTVPYTYDLIFGDKIVEDKLKNITVGTANPDQIALAVMDWEEKYFLNPYSHYNPNSTLQKYGFYKINNSYKWFKRNSPVSWVIKSKLANCEEYARVFVYLMNKSGIKSRLIHAPGEDHSWAEYYNNDFKIVVDPSSNEVIENTKKWATGRNWSYIKSVNIFDKSDKKEVTKEYVETGFLNVAVFEDEEPIENARIIIKNPDLSEGSSERYKSPKLVLAKKTNGKGNVRFTLGENKYIVEYKEDHLIYSLLYSKNVTVTPKNNKSLYFNLDVAKNKIYWFWEN